MAFVNSSGETSETRVSFMKEIQLMMYGLGDCSKPLETTATLVETIVLDQLKRLMIQAEEVAEMRGEEIVGPEDILFLMKRNEPALKRLITYLGIKDEKAILNKALQELVDIDFEGQMRMEDEPSQLQWKKTRKGYCLEFLKTIGIEETDLDMTEDTVKESRQIRANNKTMDMSSTAYQEYHKARCASFSSAQICSQKFLDWLRQGGMEQTLTTPVAEILVYLAKETVANIVDMALIVREEAPFQMTEPSPITPSEIHEVIRRCTYQQTLPFAGFSRDLPRTADKKIFTL
ncbi:transcription initiation protein SPT3 homolog [Halyomorpha halys]|uniref:transcription initiation protein SPT3 homolog n=1 Tax=Halyomorpha halys TaxID=286706 RepID=UPI0006D4C6B3|nr:transcription initiation protein SPT3 homolog [Halyomorpha halys]